MEHRVHFASSWQVELVGHLSDAINHTKRPEELEGKFVICTLSNGSLYVGLETEKYLVPHRENALAPVFVSLNFHTLLHSKKMLANGSDDQFTLPEPNLDVRRCNRASSYDAEVAGLPAVKKLEGRLAQGGMPIGVEPELAQRNPPGPVLRMSQDETVQVTFNGLVHVLCLSISFRMVSCTKL
jgi:hypothetical protein